MQNSSIVYPDKVPAQAFLALSYSDLCVRATSQAADISEPNRLRSPVRGNIFVGIETHEKHSPSSVRSGIICARQFVDLTHSFKEEDTRISKQAPPGPLHRKLACPWTQSLRPGKQNECRQADPKNYSRRAVSPRALFSCHVYVTRSRKAVPGCCWVHPGYFHGVQHADRTHYQE